MNKKGQRIIALRKKGRTYAEISRALNIPKSTVAWWLRGGVKISISLERKMLERSRKKWRKNINEFNKVYGKIRSEEAARSREKYKKEAAKDIKRISKKDLKLIGSALYWAEGSNHRNSFRFANSDPEMVKIMMKFLREVCNIPDEKIKARIHLYPHINKEKANSYWKNITGLSSSSFHKPQTQISKASKRKRPINKLLYGTLHLSICSTETAFRARGWIKGICENV
jgi:transcriptional regulator with XRE-family HTH domain